MMHKKNPIILISSIFLLLLAMLYACTNSDSYLYDGTGTTEVSVEAQMATTFDTSKAIIKSDTILEGDSIILIANVKPAKSIKTNDFYWTIDNMILSRDFNTREQIRSLGYHNIVFFLIDCFNDTLTDTLHLWVTKAPTIDTSTFLPADGAYGIPPNETIQFAWNANNIDSTASLSYHFILRNLLDDQDNNKNIIDTFIDKPYFNYTEFLKPLTPYQWEVQARNNFSVYSNETIKSTFKTKGDNKESGFYGKIESTSDSIKSLKIIAISEEDSGKIYSTHFDGVSSSKYFTLKPIPPGSYRIAAAPLTKSDYRSDTLDVILNNSELQNIGKIKLKDKVSPVIKSLTNKDELSFCDSLQFKITDGSAENIIANTKAYLGNFPIDRMSIDKDIFTIYLNDFNRSWAPQILTIVATDNSGNKTQKKFTIQPSQLWFDANSDTTISTQDSLIVFVSDKNPNSFVTKLFVFNIFGNLRSTMYIETKGEKDYSYQIYGSAFHSKEQIAKITVTYANGIEQTKTWKITLNQPPSMSYEHNCLYPCDMSANTTADFSWLPAEDEEKDSLLYRVAYTQDSVLTDSSKIIYATEYSSSTTVTITNLPIGVIYWWVEAKDSYGGVSGKWETMAKTTIYDTELGEIGNEDDH